MFSIRFAFARLIASPARARRAHASCAHASPIRLPAPPGAGRFQPLAWKTLGLFGMVLFCAAAAALSGCGSSVTPNGSSTGTTAAVILLAAAPTSIGPGDITTLAVSVASTNGLGYGVPTGVVSFTGDSNASLGSVTLSALDGDTVATGTIVLSGSSLTTGSNVIVAKYYGDAYHTAASSPSVTITVSGTTAVLTTMTMAANPASVPLGGCTSLTGTVAGVTASGGVPPTGKVSFYLGTVLLGTALAAGSTTTSTATLSVCSGVNSPFPATGSYNLTASYPGDPNYEPSASASVVFTVTNSSNDSMVGSAGGSAGDSMHELTEQLDRRAESW